MLEKIFLSKPCPLLQDLHTVNLEEFRHGGTNITAFRLVDPNVTQSVVQDWIYGEQRYQRKLDLGQYSNKVCHKNESFLYSTMIPFLLQKIELLQNK